jgi:BRCT domain type II-containing protein
LEIIPIYKIGTDKATDEKISQLTPNNAPVLPYIVDKYDEVPKDFSDEIDLENEYVVFTGKLNGGTRYDIEKFAKKLGANVQKSLNSKTTLLVVGEKPGPSKVSKAKQLGIKIINEAEYSDLVEKQIKSYEERREKNSTNEIVNVRSY